jgi:hypothetical protein
MEDDDATCLHQEHPIRDLASGDRPDIEPISRESATTDRDGGCHVRLGYAKDCAMGRRLIATLAAFGLVVKDAGGKLAMTALAKGILHPANQFERDAALVDAARLPPLFRAAHDHFDGRPLDREELVHWLRRHGVEKSAIEATAHVYSKTAAFVSECRHRMTQVVAAVTERQHDMAVSDSDDRGSPKLEATDLAWE